MNRAPLEATLTSQFWFLTIKNKNCDVVATLLNFHIGSWNDTYRIFKKYTTYCKQV